MPTEHLPSFNSQHPKYLGMFPLSKLVGNILCAKWVLKIFSGSTKNYFSKKILSTINLNNMTHIWHGPNSFPGISKIFCLFTMSPIWPHPWDFPKSCGPMSHILEILLHWVNTKIYNWEDVCLMQISGQHRYTNWHDKKV